MPEMAGIPGFEVEPGRCANCQDSHDRPETTNAASVSCIGRRASPRNHLTRGLAWHQDRSSPRRHKALAGTPLPETRTQDLICHPGNVLEGRSRAVSDGQCSRSICVTSPRLPLTPLAPGRDSRGAVAPGACAGPVGLRSLAQPGLQRKIFIPEDGGPRPIGAVAPAR